MDIFIGKGVKVGMISAGLEEKCEVAPLVTGRLKLYCQATFWFSWSWNGSI